MLRQKIEQIVLEAVAGLGLTVSEELSAEGGSASGGKAKIAVTYPDSKLGDYSSNAGLILAKTAKMQPLDLANKIVEKMDKSQFEKVEAVAPGFINFKLKTEQLLTAHYSLPTKPKDSSKILVEYFQPNIAKPMHMGLMRTAVIGDTIKRMLIFQGFNVESDTHMGDWGTQFGFLILAKKKFGEVNEKLYAQLNSESEKDESIREAAKQEFVKLEKADAQNRKIWQDLVEESMEEFLKINELMDILPFDHHWPESFFEDKMPAVLEKLKVQGLLKESQGAQIVDLESQGLGVAVIVKSDGGTTYLLRDLATFIYRKEQGFQRQLYVVDNRQSHAFRQLFAILRLLSEIKDGDRPSKTGESRHGGTGAEAEHIDYGFISFKGGALSTRKGNMVLIEDVIAQAEEKVAKIIDEKNPGLKNKEQVIKAVTKAALKYFDLKHNRHSDIEFSWDEVLDFEGDSGPYLQYAYARLASILKKSNAPGAVAPPPLKLRGGQGELPITPTERELLFKLSILSEIVEDAIKDFLPNILANYLYNLATLINKFYHESPVIAEKDENVKNFRLNLINSAKNTLGKGLDLLGIKALEEM